MLALALSLASLPAADPKVQPDPRRVAESYLTAALTGKPEQAVKFALEGKKPADPENVQKFRAGVGVEKLALPTVFYSDKKGFAVAVSEEIRFPARAGDLERGVIVVTLLKNKDGAWRVRDLDARPSKDAAAFLDKAKKAADDVKELPVPKS